MHDVDKSIIHHSHMVLVMFTVNFNIHDALWLYVKAQTNGGLWYSNIRLFLNQAHAGLRPACAWFLEIVPVRMSVCVFVCVFVCVSAPRLVITSGVMWCDMDPI